MTAQASLDLLARGERLLAAGRAEAAIGAFRTASGAGEAQVRGQALDGLGRAWLAFDRPTEALAAFDAAIASGSPEAPANRALALLRLGRAAQAALAAETVLVRDPAQARARAVRGAARLARGESANAPAAAPEAGGLPRHAGEAIASEVGELTVGIAWTCDLPHDRLLDDAPQSEGALRHSLALDRFIRYFGAPDVRLVALRRGPADPAAARLAQVGLLTDPWPAPGADEPGLVTALGKLDLVICADGRIAELAGLLGRPGFVLLAAGALPRWPLAAPAAWQKSLRAFRQTAPGDWDSALTPAARALEEILRGRPKLKIGVPAPERARQAQQRMLQGNRLHRKGDATGALEAWLESVRLDGRLHPAWGNIGVALRGEGLAEAALACYRRAAYLGGEQASVLGNMGNALKDCDRIDEAIDLHRRAVVLEPKNPTAHHNLGISYRHAGRYRDAIACFTEALNLKPDLVTAQWDLALILLHTGDFELGWPLYEARWKLPEQHMPKLDKPMWDGGALAGRTILLHSEQGFGDAIQCMRYVGAVKARGAGRVVVDCRPPLARLFAAVDGVDAVVPRGTRLPAYDVHCPLNSLPGLFKTGLATIPGTIPFLKVPQDAGESPRARGTGAGDGRLKVGIVWSGSVTFKDNRRRAATLGCFLRHFALPDVALFSLQKGPPEAEMRALGKDAPVVDLAPSIEDFADTAAAIRELDLVLMTDSAVVHLAGALGRPVWVLLPFHAHWLWLERRGDTPWYPSVRFFRQPTAGDWETPFAQAAAELGKLAAKRGAN